MNSYLVKRNFAKNSGMAHTGDILTDLPEPYASDWTALGFIVAYTATSDPIPHTVEMDHKPLIKRTGGKPKDPKTK
jgi:hypothetical protein